MYLAKEGLALLPEPVMRARPVHRKDTGDRISIPDLRPFAIVLSRPTYKLRAGRVFLVLAFTSSIEVSV